MRSKTKPGTIYFIESKSQGAIKVGFADDLYMRLKGLQTGNPAILTIKAEIPGTRECEELIHRLLKKYRTNREWYPATHLFDMLIDDLNDFRLDRAMEEIQVVGGQDLDGIYEAQIIRVTDVYSAIKGIVPEYDAWLAAGSPMGDEYEYEADTQA